MPIFHASISTCVNAHICALLGCLRAHSQDGTCMHCRCVWVSVFLHLWQWVQWAVSVAVQSRLLWHKCDSQHIVWSHHYPLDHRVCHTCIHACHYRIIPFSGMNWCAYVCGYVCLNECIDGWMYVWIFQCMYARRLCVLIGVSVGGRGGGGGGGVSSPRITALMLLLSVIAAILAIVGMTACNRISFIFNLKYAIRIFSCLLVSVLLYWWME